MYVATLTADEISFAGGTGSIHNPSLYLINNFQKNNTINSWTLSLSNSDSDGGQAFFLSFDGNFGAHYIDYNYQFARPAIVLKSNVEVTNNGEGTRNNPYVIAN